LRGEVGHSATEGTEEHRQGCLCQATLGRRDSIAPFLFLGGKSKRRGAENAEKERRRSKNSGRDTGLLAAGQEGLEEGFHLLRKARMSSGAMERAAENWCCCWL
jgi:hypothetical protein